MQYNDPWRDSTCKILCNSLILYLKFSQKSIPNFKFLKFSYLQTMKGEDDFRLRFISALAKLTPEEWKILKNKILEIAGEINKAAQ